MCNSSFHPTSCAPWSWATPSVTSAAQSETAHCTATSGAGGASGACAQTTRTGSDSTPPSGHRPELSTAATLRYSTAPTLPQTRSNSGGHHAET